MKSPIVIQFKLLCTRYGEKDSYVDINENKGARGCFKNENVSKRN